MKSSRGVCGLISATDRAERAIQTGLARASSLLYCRHMPAQVVVVTRSRRSLFAAPRALPDWLRSVWAALSRTPAIVDPAPSTSPCAKDSPLFPQLVRDASGSHRCVGCDLCVRVCPSRCLLLEIEGGGRWTSGNAFRTRPWRVHRLRNLCRGVSAGRHRDDGGSASRIRADLWTARAVRSAIGEGLRPNG